MVFTFRTAVSAYVLRDTTRAYGSEKTSAHEILAGAVRARGLVVLRDADDALQLLLNRAPILPFHLRRTTQLNGTKENTLVLWVTVFRGM